VPVGSTKKRPTATKADARVIELRSHPFSFAYIANELGLAHARDAFDAFLLALQARPAAERRNLGKEENSRLDELEKRTRKRSEPEQLDKKLAAIATLRKRLTAATA
jgi:nucleoside-diphosphate-sugar epimerase